MGKNKRWKRKARRLIGTCSRHRLCITCEYEKFCYNLLQRSSEFGKIGNTGRDLFKLREVLKGDVE